MSDLNTTPQVSDDEIDLFELIETLWREKLTIIGIAVVFALGGGGYAFMATPTYEASVSLLPPTTKDIAELTKGSAASVADSTSTSTSTVYDQFTRVLESNQLRKEFLTLAPVQSAFVTEGSTPQSIWKGLSDSVSVSRAKGNADKIDVKVSYKDAAIAADLANSFVSLGLDRTRQLLVSDFNEQLKQQIGAVEDQIASRRATYVTQIDNEISKLQDALFVANRINQTGPIDIQQIIEASPSTQTVDELRRLYRSGSDALEAEIELLTERKKDLSLVSGLSELQQRLSLLTSIKLDEAKILPATVDLAAMVPESPVKPKKSLILALSIVLGGMVGVVLVLIRQAVRNRRKTS